MAEDKKSSILSRYNMTFGPPFFTNWPEQLAKN
jgi:hypothetical protein